MNADDSGLEKIFELAWFPGIPLISPQWSADGANILFGRTIINLTDGSTRELPTSQGALTSWSPDGSRIAVLVPESRRPDAAYTLSAD